MSKPINTIITTDLGLLSIADILASPTTKTYACQGVEDGLDDSPGTIISITGINARLSPTSTTPITGVRMLGDSAVKAITFSHGLVQYASSDSIWYVGGVATSSLVVGNVVDVDLSVFSDPSTSGAGVVECYNDGAIIGSESYNDIYGTPVPPECLYNTRECIAAFIGGALDNTYQGNSDPTLGWVGIGDTVVFYQYIQAIAQSIGIILDVGVPYIDATSNPCVNLFINPSQSTSEGLDQFSTWCSSYGNYYVVGGTLDSTDTSAPGTIVSISDASNTNCYELVLDTSGYYYSNGFKVGSYE